MRIDLNSSTGQISGDLSSTQTSTQRTAQPEPAATEDRTTLTSGSSSIASLVSTALSFPEVRQETVSNLRQAVTNGQYQLDPAQIAKSIVDDYA